VSFIIEIEATFGRAPKRLSKTPYRRAVKRHFNKRSHARRWHCRARRPNDAQRRAALGLWALRNRGQRTDDIQPPNTCESALPRRSGELLRDRSPGLTHTRSMANSTALDPFAGSPQDPTVTSQIPLIPDTGLIRKTALKMGHHEIDPACGMGGFAVS